MAGLAQTIAKLARHRRTFNAALGGAEAPSYGEPASRLREVAAFGPNPGNLRMLTYVPETVAKAPALVVVLHGCTQNAAGYDHGTGWSHLAEQHGFVLLYPEQKSANNPKNCFTWFERGDIGRDAGEALSIRSMVAQMVKDHGVDPGRIFVTGLSAGGAMANVMLATYPEVFAGGAVISGLPYGAATSVAEAFEAMFKGASRPGATWGDLVRSASRHKGPWPKVSVWHGTADRTVVAANALETVKQWTNVHGLPDTPAALEQGAGFSRQVWRDAEGRETVESVTIPGMAHGTPLAIGDGEECCGNAGPFLLDVGISSTHHVARFFGILDERAAARTAARPAAAAAAEPTTAPLTPRPEDIQMPGEREFPGGPARAAETEPTPGHHLPVDIESVITKALRAAGLMRG
jgi:feruloyl esterase